MSCGSETAPVCEEGSGSSSWSCRTQECLRTPRSRMVNRYAVADIKPSVVVPR